MCGICLRLDCGPFLIDLDEDDNNEVFDGVVDDSAPETSYRLDIEIMPTLIRVADGEEVGRASAGNPRTGRSSRDCMSSVGRTARGAAGLWRARR